MTVDPQDMVCYAEPPEPEIPDVVDADGLIDPSIFPVRHDRMDLGALGDASASLRTMADAVVQRTDGVATSWSGLRDCYSSPEAEAVYALMVPAQTAAGQVAERLRAAAGALDGYAQALGGFKGRLKTKVEECEKFRTEALAGVDLQVTETNKASAWDYTKEVFTLGHYDKKVHVSWREDGGKGGMVDRNERLRADYAALVTEAFNLAVGCANQIVAASGLSAEQKEALGVATPMETISADDLLAVWGPAAEEDRNCMEQTGQGFVDFGTGLWDGARMLVGYDPSTGKWSWGTAGQAWGGVVNVVGSVVVMAVSTPYVVGLVVRQALGQDTNTGFDNWMYARAETTASLVGYDPAAAHAGGDGWHNWKDEPWRAGTSVVLNVATFFIPGAGEVAGGVKGVSTAAKVARVAGVGARGAAEVIVPGGSWAVRAASLLTHGGAALAHGGGWAGALDAMRVASGGVRPSVVGVTAGTVGAADLGRVTPPTTMHPDVPSVSGSVRPVEAPRLPQVGDVAGGPRPGAGVAPHVEPAGAPASGAAGSPARAETPGGPVRVPDTLPPDAQSWLSQGIPEPSAAERAAGAVVGEPVREPVLATVGAEPAHVPTAEAGGPGGGALDATGRADASPRASVLTEPRPALDGPARPTAPDHGPSTSPGSGGGGPAGPTHTGNPGGPPVDRGLPEHPTGDTPPNGGSPDAPPHDAPSPDAADGPGGAEPPADPDRVRDGADGDGPGRVAIDDTGSPHVINTSDPLVLAHDQPFSEVIDQVAADHGLTRAQLEDLVTTPVDRLTRDQIHTLVEIRDAMPPVTPDTVLQKIVPPDTAARVLAGDSAALRETGGFVARAADTARMPTSELYSRLGLDYPDSPFRPDGDMFAVRYRGGDPVFSGGEVPAVVRDTNGVLDAMGRMPDEILDMPAGPERTAAMQQWIGDNAPELARQAEWALDPDNAFRGNGFGGSGSGWAPEVRYPSNLDVPQGAEMWRITPDGSQQLAAVFRDGKWHPIVEQPLGGPDWTPSRGGGSGPGPVDPVVPGGGHPGPVRGGDAGATTPVGEHLPEGPATPDDLTNDIPPHGPSTSPATGHGGDGPTGLARTSDPGGPGMPVDRGLPERPSAPEHPAGEVPPHAPVEPERPAVPEHPADSDVPPDSGRPADDLQSSASGDGARPWDGPVHADGRPDVSAVPDEHRGDAAWDPAQSDYDAVARGEHGNVGTIDPDQPSSSGLTMSGRLIDPGHIPEQLQPYVDQGLVVVDDGVLRLADDVELTFNRKNPNHDWDEFVRQVDLQGHSLGQQSVESWQANRSEFMSSGRREGTAQEAYRDQQVQLYADGLVRDQGLTPEAARVQAESDLAGQDALHGPDQSAGGNPLQFTGLGDRGVNRSLGSQWGGRGGNANLLRQSMRDALAALPPELWGDVRMNVRLELRDVVPPGS